MTSTRFYAMVLLPSAVTLAALMLAPRCGIYGLHACLLCTAIFYALAHLGYQAEAHHFREADEAIESAHYAWFYLGLPIVYALSIGCGLFLYRFTKYPAEVPILVSVGLLLFGLWYVGTDHHHRGRRVQDARYVKTVAEGLLPAGDSGIPFGGVPIATNALTSSICFVGTTGSGKTTCITQILSVILPQIGRGSESSRCLIYDPKTEFFGFASSHACCPVVTLHPFDARGRSWGMAKDIRTPKAAGQFSSTIIPQEDGPNSYFSNAARGLFRGVLMSYILNSPDDWTFRDLILGCETERKLRAILTRNEETKSVVSNYLDVREATSILSSLDTFLVPYRPIAACWAHADPVSLRDWVDGNFILILPQDESARDALGRINGIVAQFLTEELLAKETNQQLVAQGKPSRRTFFVIDEVRDIAKNLPCLTALLTRGRAFGIPCVLGYQSQSGMKDAIDLRAAELIGMCSFLGMLRVQEQETAEYLSSTIGEREVWRKSVTRSDSGTSSSFQLTREPAVLPAAFSDLPTETLSGYFLAPPPLGLWRADLPWPKRGVRNANTPPDFVPRDTAEQYLIPWNEADLVRLKLPLSLLHDEGNNQGRPPEHKRDKPAEQEQDRPKTKVVPSR